MAFSAQADGLVFDRNGPGKRTVIEGNSEAIRTAEKLCFAETSPGVPSLVHQQPNMVLTIWEQSFLVHSSFCSNHNLLEKLGGGHLGGSF